MEGRDILEAIHKVDKELASLSSKVCADIANIKDLAIGNYKELSREVDELRRDVGTNKEAIAAQKEFQEASLRQQKQFMWIVAGVLALVEVAVIYWK